MAFMLAALDGQGGSAALSGERALEVATETDDRIIAALSLMELGVVRLTQHRPGEALELFQRAATLQRAFGNRGREAIALNSIGIAHRRLRRPQEATAFHRQAILIHRENGDSWRLANALDDLGSALAESGDRDQAEQQWAEALTVLTGLSDTAATELATEIRQKMAE